MTRVCVEQKYLLTLTPEVGDGDSFKLSYYLRCIYIYDSTCQDYAM